MKTYNFLQIDETASGRSLQRVCSHQLFSGIHLISVNGREVSGTTRSCASFVQACTSMILGF